jgi:hypothetical protein
MTTDTDTRAREIAAGLTPAQRNNLACIVANGGGHDDIPVAEGKVLLRLGLARYAGSPYRLGRKWYRTHAATADGRVVARVIAGEGVDRG